MATTSKSSPPPRQPQPGLAQFRRHRQGALAHPPLPQDARTKNRPPWASACSNRRLPRCNAEARRPIGAGSGIADARKMRRQTQGRNPRRYWPGQAPHIVVARQLLHRAKIVWRTPPPRHHHSRHRRHGGATGQMLPPDSRRPHPRLHPQGPGLIIHTHDCPSIAHFRADPDKWLDVEWEAETRKMFDVPSSSWSPTSAACSPRSPRPSPSTAPTSTMWHGRRGR